jgi:fimbrial chaperone protein
MRKFVLPSLVFASLVALSAAPQAASLQVAPVRVEVAAPGAASTITLRNEGSTPLNAQIRVFRWVQRNGEDKLEPTEDVVASPPGASLAPKTDYTVRLVRVTKRPLEAGESYRLLVDELPDPKSRQNGVVTLVMRYSIPVFFSSRASADAKLAWSVEQRGSRVYVSAANAGDQPVRISFLRASHGGRTVSFGDGLAGYVLGRSTMRWQAPGQFPRADGGPVTITAQSDRGPINALAPAQEIR